MPNSFLGLSLGIVFLVISTKTLVGLAKKLPSSLKISPLIIGITIVAFGTSLPELAISSIASAREDLGLAMGNIIGSNIINSLMVFPIGILMGRLRVGKTKTQRNALILLAVTAFFVILHLMPVDNHLLGLLLLTAAISLTIVEYQWAVLGRRHEDLPKLKTLRKRKFTFGDLLLLTASVAGIVIGGYLTVTMTESLAFITGYSTTILGLSLTAIATSLPELLTTFFSQEEGQEKLTMGNIIGSNIYNLLLIGGVVNLFSPTAFVPPRDWLTLAFATIFFVFILRYYRGKKVPKKIGITMLLCLIGYLYWLSQSK